MAGKPFVVPFRNGALAGRLCFSVMVGKRARRVVQTFTSPDSYGLLFLLIGLSYIVSVSVTGRRWFSVVLFIQMLTLWLAVHTSQGHRTVRVVASILLIFAFFAAITNIIVDQDRVRVLAEVAALLLYFLAPWVIVRHLVARHEIDEQTLLGAICAYLLIGMFYAFFYQFLGHIQAGPFFGSQGEGTPAQYLYFSFTTLTTTGYGNLVPAVNPGQTVSVTEMILGQLFLIAAVGKVIAEWRPRQRVRGPSEPTEPPKE